MSSQKRRYELKERARRQADTRRRITDAAVELHRSVGPARTTISEIAKRAGVRRMTVYNHFPDDAALLAACSARYDQRHPAPDPDAWAAERDPALRLERALAELYAYYRGSADMLGHVLRDAALVPALAELMDQTWWPALEAMVDALMAGRGARGRRARRVRAALRLAVDFATWRTLTAGAGLDDAQAAALMRSAVAAA